MLRDFSLLLMAIIATLALIVGWDKEFGVPLLQLALVFGGVLIGHVVTDVLNRESDEEQA